MVVADTAQDTVVVTGVGCMLAVGDSVHGTAAIRAGLSRPSPTGLVVGTKDDELPVPVKAHACRGFEGGQGLGRLLALLRAGVGDLRRQGVVPAGSATTFVHLPELEQRPRALDLAPRFLTPDAVQAEVGKRLRPVAGDGEFTVQHGGRCGAMVSLAAAVELLRARRVPRCLVLAVDSLVEEATLEVLYGQDQLQTPANQDGFFAGEGAAIVQVELAEVARQQGRAALAVLGSPRVEVGGDAAPGVALARLLAGLAAPTEVWSDLNGQVWRANDWGHALHRLAASRWPGLAARVHTPVEGTGELGAASVPTLLVLAARAAARPGAGLQLVVAADEGGDRAALTVSAVPPH